MRAELARWQRMNAPDFDGNVHRRERKVAAGAQCGWHCPCMLRRFERQDDDCTREHEGGEPMAHETIDGTYRQTNLRGESAEYLAKREELRRAEIDLMNRRENVAELRRRLPPGPLVQDYELVEGPAALDEGDTPQRKVRLSQLFTSPDRTLVIYQLMYGKKQTEPCPMCTSWLDAFNGVAHHLAQNIDLAVVAAADLRHLRAHARTRGWHRLRLLSAGESTFKYDTGSEDEAGNQDSAISVFTLEKGGVRHFYTVHPRLADDIDTRGIDEYNPTWNILDLTPQGRGDWDASLEYGTRVPLARH